MKRLTTDNPKDNMETAFNLFYIKNHEVWVRGGGLAPEYADTPLFDFIRRAVAAHIPDAELPEDNDDLSMMMAEWLIDDIDSAEGILAILYTAAWAYAELRHRLATYENTGLEPEEIVKAFEGKKAVFNLYFGVDQKRIAHLHDLLQAEQEGRLLILPCRVGGVLYEADPEHGVVTHTIRDVSWTANSHAIDDAGNAWWGFWCPDDIGIAHRTREEAEAALDGGRK